VYHQHRSKNMNCLSFLFLCVFLSLDRISAFLVSVPTDSRLAQPTATRSSSICFLGPLDFFSGSGGGGGGGSQSSIPKSIAER